MAWCRSALGMTVSASRCRGDQDRFGLVGMKERAELVGATLEVESSPGHGTTVYLRSPLARTAAPKRTHIAGVHVTPIRVLIADDHEIVRHGLRLLVEAQEDMEVVAEASDGQVALDRARALQPDLVILDLSMPA